MTPTWGNLSHVLVLADILLRQKSLFEILDFAKIAPHLLSISLLWPIIRNVASGKSYEYYLHYHPPMKL